MRPQVGALAGCAILAITLSACSSHGLAHTTATIRQSTTTTTTSPPATTETIPPPTTTTLPLCPTGDVSSTVSYLQPIENDGSGNYNTTFYGVVTSNRTDVIANVGMSLTLVLPNGSTSPALAVSLDQTSTPPADAVATGQSVSWVYPIGAFPFAITSATITIVSYDDASASPSCGP
jgi:hypothetical protein